MTQPWMKFYPSDWRADPRLRMCGLAARGLWMEMLALMHEATPYGHLLISGISPTDAQLAVLVGAPSDQIPGLLGELEAAGVFSRTRSGAIYSRRMTRDDKKAVLERKSGQLGGNPKLVGDYNKEGYVYVMGRRADGGCKVGISVNPANRIKKVRAQYRNDDIAILAQFWTKDMGTLEATLHRTLPNNLGGEWFRLSDEDIENIRVNLDPKGPPKGGSSTQKPDTRSQIPERRDHPLSQKSSPRDDDRFEGQIGATPLSRKSLDPLIADEQPFEAPARDAQLARFPEFWAAFPLKVRMDRAEGAFITAIARGTPAQTIIDGAAAYAAACAGKEARFIAQPVNWLTERRWTDQAPVPPQPERSPSVRRLEAIARRFA